MCRNLGLWLADRKLDRAEKVRGSETSEIYKTAALEKVDASGENPPGAHGH
jgi:hypothetical protein